MAGGRFYMRELLLLVIIMVLSAVLIIPAVVEVHQKAARNQMLQNGRQIYMALFARGFESPTLRSLREQLLMADHQRYASSTEVFRDMVSHGLLNADWSLFGGRGIPSIQSANPADFESRNNAWCLVEEAGSITDQRMPVLFTRNVDLAHTGSEPSPQLMDCSPFGTSRWIYVDRAGHAYIVPGNAINGWYTGCEIRNVLRP